MASLKREDTRTKQDEQPQAKRLKYPSHNSSISRAVLNPADCDLAFDIEANGLTGQALCEQGFAYCWSGARASVGISGGKYYFGCKIVSNQLVEMEDTPLDQQNVCRVGISRGDDPVGNLGETDNSYGYGGTGKFSYAGRFVEYGEKFGVGDTIICLVDLESQPWGSIEFCKNGKRLGIAKKFDSSPIGLGVTDTSSLKLPWESALFPHVLLKNTVVKMQFSLEDGLIPIDGYMPWTSAVKDEKAIVGPSLAAGLADCDVIMMVGLPASGKSTWAENWVKGHPKKRYVLLGTNLALDQMKVPGLLRKNNYGERFDKLMDLATGIFNTLLPRASKVPRNYIIDQTNVYKSARQRKLQPFSLSHKIAVVVFPRPEDLKLRAAKRFKEMGKDVPPEAVNKMIANFVLPMSKDMHGTDEYFDQIFFTDLNRSEAQQQLDEMKRALPSSFIERPRNDHSAFSQQSSFHSDSGLSTYSLPGPGYAHSRYSVPPAGAVPTYPVNVNTGYTGYMQPAIVGVQPYQTNVNARYESSASPYQRSLNTVQTRDTYHGAYISHNNPAYNKDLTQYGPSYGTQNPTPYIHQSPSSEGQYGARFRSNHEDARSAYQSSYGPSYANQNPSPYGQYGASPYGTYPTNVQQAGPGGIAYGPARYY